MKIQLKNCFIYQALYKALYFVYFTYIYIFIICAVCAILYFQMSHKCTEIHNLTTIIYISIELQTNIVPITAICSAMERLSFQKRLQLIVHSYQSGPINGTLHKACYQPLKNQLPILLETSDAVNRTNVEARIARHMQRGRKASNFTDARLAARIKCTWLVYGV